MTDLACLVLHLDNNDNNLLDAVDHLVGPLDGTASGTRHLTGFWSHSTALLNYFVS